MTIARYSLLLMNPTVERLDTVVAGAVFHSARGWDVRVTDNVQKMRAIDPSFSSDRLIHTPALALSLADCARDIRELASQFDGARLGVSMDRFVGSFTFVDEAEYQRQVSAVLAESVNPPTLAKANAAPVTRRRNVVRRKLRDHFKQRGIWSRSDQDINNHKVVEHYPIAPEYGVVADFALKNSVMHITETIDFEIQSPKGRRVEAQAKGFVLTEAIKLFGESTRTYVVAAGTANPEVKQSVALLADNALVYALESTADMNAYVDAIASAASAQGSLGLP